MNDQPHPIDAKDAAGPGPSASLWRHGGFIKLWSGETLSQIGSQLGVLAIPVLAVTLLGATEWQIGLLNAAETAAFLVIGLPAGAWVDRMLKRRVMIAADLVRAVALAFIPALWFLGALEMWHVYAVAVVVGVATVFFDVSYQSYVPILVRASSIADANSKLEASAQVARIGGPAIGGALLTIITAPLIVLATSIGYLFSLGFLLRIRDTEQPAPRTERRPLWREIGEGVGFVWRNRLIRRITANTAAVNFFGTMTMTLLPILVLRELAFEPAVLGVVLTVGSIGGLLGAIATPRLTKRLGEGTIIPIGALVGGIAGFGVPLAATFPWLAIPLLVIGEFGLSFAVLVYNVAQVSFRQRVCPQPLLGRMNASIRCAVWGVMPLGSLVAGALGQLIGVEATMWAGALGGLASVALVVFSPLMGMRTLPDAAKQASPAATQP